MKEKMKRMKSRFVTAGLMLSLFIMQLPIEAYATQTAKQTLKNSKLYTGSLALFNDATLVIVGLEAAVTTFFAGKEGLKYQAADEQHKPTHMQNIGKIIGAGIVVMCLTGIVSIIFSYYS